MRVCFFIDSLIGSAGSERMAVLLANHLAECEYKVSIITRQGGDKSFFKLNENIKHYYLFENSGINIYSTYFKAFKKYKAFITQINPDFIIDVCVAMSLMTLPATLSNKKIKVISWEHFNANAYFNIVTANLSKWMASKLAYSVVVLTDADKIVYQNKFNPRRISVIKNPITINVTNKANINSKYVLAIGRLTEQKGFDMLLNAWKTIISQRSEWKLKIVGGGELKESLLDLQKALNLEDCVEFIEPTLHVENYYMNSSIFVMSSRFEGLPLVLIEAKAYGLPIVSFDCETGPREIINDGVNGTLVAPNNVDNLAQSVLDLINNDNKRLSYSNNAQQNLEDYLPEKFYASWKAILLHG